MTSRWRFWRVVENSCAFTSCCITYKAVLKLLFSLEIPARLRQIDSIDERRAQKRSDDLNCKKGGINKILLRNILAGYRLKRNLSCAVWHCQQEIGNQENRRTCAGFSACEHTLRKVMNCSLVNTFSYIKCSKLRPGYPSASRHFMVKGTS